MSLSDCRLVDIPTFRDDRGSLCFAEPPHVVPFEIARIYYLFGIGEGKSRGAHGHRSLEQVMVAIHGMFEVHLDDGVHQKCFRLDRPDTGLYVSPMMWRDLRKFSDDAVCLVMASARFDEDDYFRDYDAFLAEARQ